MSKDLREIYERAEQNAKNRKDPEFKLIAIPYELNIEVGFEYDKEKITQAEEIFTEMLKNFIEVVKEDFNFPTHKLKVRTIIRTKDNITIYKYYD
tara:strand:+ start:13553 stop:13837 length:285 start_codon:yes stop_codon:yes gene_type:complete